MAAQRTMTYGVVVGNRGFFPDQLAKSGREEIITAIESAGAKAIVLTAQESKFGAVETFAEAQRCAELFKKHAADIDGIIITLPNCGDERGVADALRLSGLKVPVLVQATPEKSDAMTIATRRDSFCGKMSACNNLMQYGIPYSLTKLHTEAPAYPEFKSDLDWFGAVCRIVRGLTNLRIGAIGARPSAFNTVRYSERILETSGISVEPIDLSEILGRINRMGDNDDAAQAKLSRDQSLRQPCRHPRSGAGEDGQARRSDRWLDEADRRHHQRRAVLDLDGRILRRRSLHHHEHDVERAHPLGLRSRRTRHPEYAHARPRLRHSSALLDLEQQLRQPSRDKCVCFHCSNLPKHFFNEVKMDFQGNHHCWHGRQRKHLRHLRRPRQERCNELRALSLPPTIAANRARLLRPGQVHRRSSDHLWRRGVAEIPKLQSCC